MAKNMKKKTAKATHSNPPHGGGAPKGVGEDKPKIVLYQLFTEKQLTKFVLQQEGCKLSSLTVHELKDKKNDLHGDFVFVKQYKFKKVYAMYQCMQTPTEKHQVKKAPYFKAETDSRNWK